MRVLVTGGTGFVGRHLVKALESHARVTEIHVVSRSAARESLLVCRARMRVNRDLFGYVESLDSVPVQKQPLDCGCRDEVGKYLGNLQPDVIFHLAANPNIRPDRDDPCGFGLFRDNVAATHNLLAHAPEGCRFVFASSAAVYGNKGYFNACDESEPLSATSFYGATKVASEALVDAFTALGRVRGVSLRLVANVGPGVTHGSLRDIVRKLRAPDTVLELLGKAPGSVRPFAHVSDTVAALLHFGFQNQDCDPTNVGPCDSISALEVAQTAMEAMGIHKEVAWTGSSWKGDNPVVRIRCCHEPRWKPKYETSKAAVFQAAKELGAIPCPKAA